MRQIQEMRQARQQTELLRQQTEALRKQNQQVVAAPPSFSPDEVKTPAPPINYADLAMQAEGPPSSWKTAGLHNGRGWRVLSATEKTYFLSGMKNAVQVTAESSTYFPTFLTMDEFAAILDRYYAEPINRSMPIVFAAQAATMKANGESLTTVETFLTAIWKALELDPAK